MIYVYIFGNAHAPSNNRKNKKGSKMIPVVTVAGGASQCKYIINILMNHQKLQQIPEPFNQLKQVLKLTVPNRVYLGSCIGGGLPD